MAVGTNTVSVVGIGMGGEGDGQGCLGGVLPNASENLISLYWSVLFLQVVSILRFRLSTEHTSVFCEARPEQ